MDTVVGDPERVVCPPPPLAGLGAGRQALRACAKAARQAELFAQGIPSPPDLDGVVPSGVESEAMELLLWSGVTAAAERGDASAATSLADSARAIGARGLRDLRLLDALLQLTNVEEARAGGVDAASSWASVAATFDRIGSPWPAAYCRYHQARSTLAGRSDRQEAAATLAQARHTAAHLGTRPLLAKIDDLARRSRLDVRRAAPRRVPHGLSEREVEVLTLVRDGLTNPEIAAALFVSPKTASHHVSSILAKLGVHTRRQAADRARQLGL